MWNQLPGVVQPFVVNYLVELSACWLNQAKQHSAKLDKADYKDGIALGQAITGGTNHGLVLYAPGNNNVFNFQGHDVGHQMIDTCKAKLANWKDSDAKNHKQVELVYTTIDTQTGDEPNDYGIVKSLDPKKVSLKWLHGQLKLQALELYRKNPKALEPHPFQVDLIEYKDKATGKTDFYYITHIY